MQDNHRSIDPSGVFAPANQPLSRPTRCRTVGLCLSMAALGFVAASWLCDCTALALIGAGVALLGVLFVVRSV